MVLINKEQREFLEKIGIIKSRHITYIYHGDKVSMSNGVTIANVNSKSNKKAVYVDDYMVSYIDPEWYRRLMKPYFSNWFINEQIEQARLYISEYERSSQST